MGGELTWLMLGCWAIEVAELISIGLDPSDFRGLMELGGFSLIYICTFAGWFWLMGANWRAGGVYRPLRLYYLVFVTVAAFSFFLEMGLVLKVSSLTSVFYYNLGIYFCYLIYYLWVKRVSLWFWSIFGGRSGTLRRSCGSSFCLVLASYSSASIEIGIKIPSLIVLINLAKMRAYLNIWSPDVFKVFISEWFYFFVRGSLLSEIIIIKFLVYEWKVHSYHCSSDLCKDLMVFCVSISFNLNKNYGRVVWQKFNMNIKLN